LLLRVGPLGCGLYVPYRWQPACFLEVVCQPDLGKLQLCDLCTPPLTRGWCIWVCNRTLLEVLSHGVFFENLLHQALGARFTTSKGQGAEEKQNT
jgi:hypothetical protein